MHTAGSGPRGVRYTSVSQPYYIAAPESDRTAASTNVLHKLCSALNGLGLEAYIDAPQSIGDLWTPLLTELTRIAHYKAGKNRLLYLAPP